MLIFVLTLVIFIAILNTELFIHRFLVSSHLVNGQGFFSIIFFLIFQNRSKRENLTWELNVFFFHFSDL